MFVLAPCSIVKTSSDVGLSILTLTELISIFSGQIGNTESELKKLAEEHPDLQDAYIAKQKRLKVRAEGSDCSKAV